MSGDAILVAVEFGDLTAKSIEHAVRLVDDRGGRVDLLHVTVGALPTPTMGHPAARELLDKLVEAEHLAAMDRLDALMRTIPEAYRGEVIILSGRPADEICRIAGRGYSLVVVSTHGRTGVPHAILGSVAERVVRHAPTPVLVVR